MNRIHDRKAARPDRRTRGTIVRLGLAALVMAVALGSKCEGKPVEFYQLIGVPVPGTGDLFGRVTVDGTGRSGVTVTLRRGGAVVGTTTTDASGNYEFNDRDPGTYTVSISSITGTNCPGEQTAVVVEDDETRVDFPCTTPTPTTGTVTGRVVVGTTPQPGAQVVIPGQPPVTTNASGVFTIPNVPTGSQTVTTTLTNHTCPTRSANVVANQTANVGDIACTPNPGTLSGTVTEEGTNAPKAGVGMTLRQGTNAIATTTTDASGNYTFGQRPPGSYSVDANCPPVQTKDVTLDPGENEDVDFTCPRPATVPTPDQIQSSWQGSRSRTTTSGSCPSPLPSTWTGSASNLGNNNIGMAGIDPDVSPITGPYDPIMGAWNGMGSKVLPNGFTIGTEVEGNFGFNQNNVPILIDEMVREHRDPGGTLVCTERYDVTGQKVVTSSSRFKRGVVALLPDGATFLGLRPVAFRYVKPYGDPSVPQVGLIAEEVFRAYPDAVALDADGRPAGIWYGTLTGLVIGEMESRISRAVEAGIERVTGTP